MLSSHLFLRLLLGRRPCVPMLQDIQICTFPVAIPLPFPFRFPIIPFPKFPFISTSYGIWGSAVSSASGVWDRAPAANVWTFNKHFKPRKRVWWQQNCFCVWQLSERSGVVVQFKPAKELPVCHTSPYRPTSATGCDDLELEWFIWYCSNSWVIHISEEIMGKK